MDKEVFQIDTKGLCILCLRESSRCTSFRAIMNYLKINLLQLANLSLSSQSNSTDGEDSSDVIVPLCESCFELICKFSELYDQFEGIQLEMKSCMGMVRDLISEADGNGNVGNELERMMCRPRNAFELFTASFVKKLRKETKNKCNLKLNNMVTAHLTSHTPPNETLLLPNSSTREATEVDTTAEEFPGNPQTIIADNVLPNDDESMLESDFKVETESLTSDDEQDSRSNLCEVDINAHVSNEVEKTDVNYALTSPPHNTPCHSSTCNTCGKHFKSIRELARHLPVHSGVKPHRCECCGKAFTQKCNLRTHVISVHTMEAVENSLPPGCKEYHLNRVIKTMLEKTRMLSDDRKTPCGCPQCIRKFRSKFELRTHLLQCHFEIIFSDLQRISQKKRKVRLGSGLGSGSASTPLDVAPHPACSFNADEPALLYLQDFKTTPQDPLNL